LTCKLDLFFKTKRYDFDSDGYISKEDIRIVLSHVPMSVSTKILRLLE